MRGRNDSIGRGGKSAGIAGDSLRQTLLTRETLSALLA